MTRHIRYGRAAVAVLLAATAVFALGSPAVAQAGTAAASSDSGGGFGGFGGGDFGGGGSGGSW